MGRHGFGCGAAVMRQLMHRHTLCVCAVLLLSLVIGAVATPAAAQQEDDTANSLIHLAVNRLARNIEIENLHAKYHAFQKSDKSDDLRSHSFVYAEEQEKENGNGGASASLVSSSPHAVETQIRTGQGSHTVTVFVGGQERELIVDTGSGKTAFICDGCANCGSQHHNQPFHWTKTTTQITCDPSKIGTDRGSCMACEGSKCKYEQRYVEGDYWQAYKVSDLLAFSPLAASQGSLQAVVQFGCIYEQTGCFNAQTSDGIMGFSRHPDSIFEQFYAQNATQSRIFAQCLAVNGGALTLGGVDMAVNQAPIVYTPLRTTGYQYWTVGLDAITIGGVTLAVSSTVYNANRGCVFDSGTTFVYLPTRVQPAFEQAWRAALGGTGDAMPISDTFYRISKSEFERLPKICFHFPNNAQICMDPSAYLYEMAENEYAGTFYFGDGAKTTIIGASALMHHNIIYDVDNNRIGMAPADCEQAAKRTSGALSQETLEAAAVALELHPGGDTFRQAVDHGYWAQVALASVAFVAVAGLLLTVYEEVGRTQEKKKKEENKNQVTGEATVPPVVDVDEENGGFAFFLMEDEG